MPLTYHPFAETPEIVELGKTLKKNVPETERTVSTLAGMGVMAAALGQGGLARWAMLAVGAALLHRGWTGHCAVYEQLAVAKARAS